MLIPKGTGIKDFIDHYFVEAAMPAKLLLDEQARIVYYETEGSKLGSNVVIENRALKAFAKKYGRRLRPAELAVRMRAAIKRNANQECDGCGEAALGRLRFRYTRRGNQFFVSEIWIMEEKQ